MFDIVWCILKNRMGIDDEMVNITKEIVDDTLLLIKEIKDKGLIKKKEAKKLKKRVLHITRI